MWEFARYTKGTERWVWKGMMFLAEEIDQLFSNCELLSNCKYPLTWLQYNISSTQNRPVRGFEGSTVGSEDAPFPSSWFISGMKGLELKRNLEII